MNPDANAVAESRSKGDGRFYRRLIREMGRWNDKTYEYRVKTHNNIVSRRQLQDEKKLEDLSSAFLLDGRNE